jgi:hypothetical protein
MEDLVSLLADVSPRDPDHFTGQPSRRPAGGKHPPHETCLPEAGALHAGRLPGSFDCLGEPPGVAEGRAWRHFP